VSLKESLLGTLIDSAAFTEIIAYEIVRGEGGGEGEERVGEDAARFSITIYENDSLRSGGALVSALDCKSVGSRLQIPSGLMSSMIICRPQKRSLLS